MKILYAALFVGCLYGCSVTEDGIIINTPSVPTVNLCQNVATDAQAENMRDQIKDQTFKDEKLQRARLITKGYCFVSTQVVTVIDGFTFDDNKLTMAKELYEQTTDKNNYVVVVDSFTHKSDRDELMEYIQNNP